MSNALTLPAGVTVFERGWLSSNNVLFTGGACTAIVDTGYATHAAQTLALVRSALGPGILDLVVNTHLHSDHCGGNAALQQAYLNARTIIPPGLAQAVRSWDEHALTYASTGQRCDRFRFDGVLSPGSEIEMGRHSWQVHAAPGHDPHSVVLFEPESRTLISADALWENGFGVVFPELAGEHGFDEVAATLDLIGHLAPELVIPGHGGVFAGRSRIDGALLAARRRLDGLAADPARHASHAIKVLMKFKLLELQAVPMDAFLRWANETPYFRLVHDRFFAGQTIATWLEELLRQLERSGALGRDNAHIYNL